MLQTVSESRRNVLTDLAWEPRSQPLDETTFAQLYNHYVTKIYHYIYFKIGSIAEAEDLTAKVFTKAWNALEYYRWTARPFSAWLFRIAHNAVVDYFRTRRETVSLEGLAFELESETESLETTAERTFMASELRKAIAHLSHGQQQVIELKFLEGYSTQETAWIMRKDAGAVRALQHRALAALKRTCSYTGLT